MRTTLTIRTDEALRKSLARRAKEQGKTVSELVREILADALANRPLGAKTGHLRGGIRLSGKPKEPWRREIRDRNWRP